MFKNEPIDEEVIEISEAVFRLVRIEPEMPRNVKRDELTDFRAPTLVIAAEGDDLFSAEAVSKRARQVFPNLVAAEVIPGAAHYLSARYHTYLNERCERFLRETKWQRLVGDSAQSCSVKPDELLVGILR